MAFFSLTSHRASRYLGDRFMVILFLILIVAGYFGLGLIGGMWGFLFYYLLTSMRGLRGPMMLNLTQKESPSANRAGILSLQSLCFRLLFVGTGPLVGMLADSAGVGQAFQYLLYAFLIVLPPLAFLFLRNLPKGKPIHAETRFAAPGNRRSTMRLPARTALLAMLAMIAFAANSLLCRMALRSTGIDAGSFTSIRIISGALVLWLIVRARSNAQDLTGSWLSALALFVYAAGFSYAYVKLPTAVGALILFGAVQATMIGYGLWSGERMSGVQVFGLCSAFAGLVALLLPGLSAPPLVSSALMLSAGVAWGIYSLRGKGIENPIGATAGNFLRAVPFTVVLWVSMAADVTLTGSGVCSAVVSGGLASGVGYAIWYAALPAIKATNAATIQLSVPVIAAVGGVIFLGEAITLRVLLSSAGILGGITLVIMSRDSRKSTAMTVKQSPLHEGGTSGA